MPFYPPTPAEIDRAVKAWLASSPPVATGLGSAVTFSDIEQLATRIGRSVARQLTEQTLDEQAREQAAEVLCPQCGRACRVTRQTRHLITVPGEVCYDEPAGHCGSCRRDFFSGTYETASG
jgi:hypothetical protein